MMKTVASADGTLIAYEQGGAGPHLALVHGTTANRVRFASIRPRLEEHFTVTTMDRRGRGDSGDKPEYAIEREFDDVVAVVNAVGAPVLLFGHSYGALCALGAAMRTDKLSGLILYEPWIIAEGESLYTPEQLERLDTLLAVGDREGVAKALFAEIAGFPPHEMELLTSSPSWPDRVAAAHTIPREARAEESYRLPADQIGELSIPILLLLGGDSPPLAGRVNAMLEQALPNARTVVMPGQQHIAMETSPDLLIGAILGFWRDIS
jgi:pimeloyl-ACP methyl ester carboxylesterase